MAPQVNSLGSDCAMARDDVRAFRQAAIENGYRLVRVRSQSKKPLPHDWQHGDREAALLDVRPEAMNTGLLLAGLRCIDIDVDDEEIVRLIIEKVLHHLPSRGMIRRRLDSPRLALIYRAGDCEPGKRSVCGPHGKIEILGRGQQVVCHGLHPSGTALIWMRGQGPDTVPRDHLPAVTEDQIERFLVACSPLLGTPTAPAGVRAGAADRVLAANDELAAGIESCHWFEALSPNEKSTLLRACLGVLDNREHDPRERWLRILFAGADAERLGCPDAYQQVLGWSRQGASWTSEDDVRTAWNSAQPGRPGAVSVGSLIAMAREGSLDVSAWRNAASSGVPGNTAPIQTASAVPGSPTASKEPRRALSIVDLPLVPPKRHWLHGTDLARGAVSLLVAPGGRGKSSWLVTLALACASGRSLLGAHVFGGQLRVLFINAEDSTLEIALRFRAAMQHHHLTDADVPHLHVTGADRLRLHLLGGTAHAPTLDQAGWAALTAEVNRLQPDVVILDPLISMMGSASPNDNSAAALLMGRLVALAAERRIGIIIAHHAAKGRDPASAESAMGAASFVNLARIALGIEPLAEVDAGRVGLPPWEARSVFRVVGTKQNLSPPDASDRWFRLTPVEIDNAEPPIYPAGDRVGIVELFRPGASGPAYPPALIRDALRALDDASPPLSPTRRATGRWAGPFMAAAIAPHRHGKISNAEADAVLDHLQRTGLVVVEPVKLARSGGRSDTRNGLVLTPAGKSALRAKDEGEPNSTLPASPAPPRDPCAG